MVSVIRQSKTNVYSQIKVNFPTCKQHCEHHFPGDCHHYCLQHLLGVWSNSFFHH